MLPPRSAVRVYEKIGCRRLPATNFQIKRSEVMKPSWGGRPRPRRTSWSPHRVLIDTDPVLTQIRHLKDNKKMRDAQAHTAFFTFGENFGKPECSIPGDGLPWLPTRQPMCLGRPGANFTTVMQWDSYPAQEYGSRSFGMKSASFTPYLDLRAKRETGWSSLSEVPPPLAMNYAATAGSSPIRWP
jgi:hypothetical protein